MLNKYSKILSAILIVFISFAALVLLFSNNKTTTEVSAFACKSEHANCDNASDHDCCSGLSCQDGQGGWKCRTASAPTATPTPTCTPTPTPTVTPTVTPTPTPNENVCKHENAECEINNSDKSCCEGLACVPSGNPSGNGHCQVVTTPTPTPTPSPTIDPCADNACVTPTPTVTPTENPTPTPTPTVTQTSNSGGPGDGGSDNLGCGSHDCSGNPAPSSQGQVLGASTGPQVLGLSTTSGEENTLLQIVQALGALTSAGLGFAFFKK